MAHCSVVTVGHLICKTISGEISEFKNYDITHGTLKTTSTFSSRGASGAAAAGNTLAAITAKVEMVAVSASLPVDP
jgi:hypothetical protein